MSKRRIVLTGGGTAGHVMPNIALLDELRIKDWEIHYIGTEDGMEHSIIVKEKDVIYHSISAGKFRRYIDLKNLTDPFKVIKGYFDSICILISIKPHVIFSKGGFVSVPVVAAGRMLGIPTVIHESDITPGLANKLSMPYAKKICTTFPETLIHIKSKKAVLTGTPIRKVLFTGNASRARAKYALTKPVILIMGGSLGARSINENVRSILPRILNRFDVIHICGNGNLIESSHKGYTQLEFVTEELPDLFAVADIVVSRAGANSIFEFLALIKPMLLIPLSRLQSRGDQCDNAESFLKQGYAAVLEQEKMNSSSLYAAILDLYDNRDKYIDRLKKVESTTNGTQNVIDVINSIAKK